MSKAILALEDGTVFEGRAFGAPAERAGEVVFNTSITGYQEIFTDPSYAGQIVILTYPQIGNYGTTPDDSEAPSALHRRPGGARVLLHRQQLALPGARRRVPGRPRHPGDRRDRHPRAGAPSAHAGRHARRAVQRRRRPARACREGPQAVPSMAGLDLATRVSTQAALRLDRRRRCLLARRADRRRGRAAASTWWPTTSASSATSCAAWSTWAAA